MKSFFGSGLTKLVNAPRSAATLFVLGAAFFFSSFAYAISLPSATTQAYAACLGQESALGPAPVGLLAVCHNTNQIGGVSSQGIASASTSFGPGMPQVGNVDVYASVSSMGELPATAEADGYLTFYFASESFTPGAFNPATLPIYFEAHAQGYGSGLYGSGTPFASVILASQYAGPLHWYTSDYPSNSFDKSTTIWLSPGEVASVNLGANCYVNAFGGWDDSTNPRTPITGVGNCSTQVDPVIRFDQAAFDALYGANSFTLTDHYRLQFSENVNAVPLPPAVWLLGSGLLGLIAVARRKAD